MRPPRTTVTIGIICGLALFGRHAHGQPGDQLAAGRQLFSEALADEEGGRLAAALEKYRRVQRIRDTVPVRYRVGSTLERLGKLAQAVEAYAATVQLGVVSRTDPDVVQAAQARVAALTPRLARVSIGLPPPPWTRVEVKVDGDPVPAEHLADLPVDPGAHVVSAVAPGARPFRADVTLAEGGRGEVVISLDRTPPDPAPPSGGPYGTIGVVTGVAGGALVVGGVVLLALRSSAVSELQRSCPGGNCPADRERELRGVHDRAALEGPVGVAMLATGAAAIGTGVLLYLVGGAETKTSARLASTGRGEFVTFTRTF